MTGLQFEGSIPPQSNKSAELFDKVLELAEKLFLQELFEDTLFTCGDDFTTRYSGRFGLYETINGEVITFQPKDELIFELICPDFTIVDELGMVKTVAYHVDDYQLAIHG